MTKTFKSRLLGVLISLLVLLTGFFGVSLGLGDTEKVAFADACSFSNGFCTTHSDCYEGCDTGDNYCFQITNGGQLFWFAQMVNENGATSINGKLVNDINLEDRAFGRLSARRARLTRVRSTATAKPLRD